MACRCRDKALSLGYKYIAIRYFGECYGGGDMAKYARLTGSNQHKSTQCANTNFGQCTNHNDGSECAGHAGSEYIYLLANSNSGETSMFLFIFYIEFLILLLFYATIYINLHFRNKVYRKSSNNSPGAYLPTKIFWVGAYSSRGLI